MTVTERYAHLQPGRLHELATATSSGVTNDVTKFLRKRNLRR